ncbi:MAG: TRAP transporter small permease [Lachnospirales bacterium]
MRKLQSMLDKIAVNVSAVMLALMMIVLFANIILRYVPGVGGFKWYMEGSQYLNVWAMFVVGISISIKGEHLNVNVLLDALKGKAQLIAYGVVAFFTTLFYIGLTYGMVQLASKSKQFISTMQPLKMAHVYWVIPVLTTICAVGVVVEYIIRVQDFKNDKEENK